MQTHIFFSSMRTSCLGRLQQSLLQRAHTYDDNQKNREGKARSNFPHDMTCKLVRLESVVTAHHAVVFVKLNDRFYPRPCVSVFSRVWSFSSPSLSFFTLTVVSLFVPLGVSFLHFLQTSEVSFSTFAPTAENCAGARFALCLAGRGALPYESRALLFLGETHFPRSPSRA